MHRVSLNNCTGTVPRRGAVCSITLRTVPTLLAYLPLISLDAPDHTFANSCKPIHTFNNVAYTGISVIQYEFLHAWIVHKSDARKKLFLPMLLIYILVQIVKRWAGV